MAINFSIKYFDLFIYEALPIQPLVNLDKNSNLTRPGLSLYTTSFGVQQALP